MTMRETHSFVLKQNTPYGAIEIVKPEARMKYNAFIIFTTIIHLYEMNLPTKSRLHLSTDSDSGPSHKGEA